MKQILLLAAAVSLAFAAQAQTDLFFSEYLEGSSQNKALEIYNPTDQTISLDGYKIQRFSNGSNQMTEQLEIVRREGPNEIGPYEAIVVSNGQIEENEFGAVDSTLYFDIADVVGSGLHATSPMYFNGNDAIALLSPSDMPLDLIGKIGQDPINGWNPDPDLNYISDDDHWWRSWTSNNIMVRKYDIVEGVTANPSFFDPSVQWDSIGWDSIVDNNWVTLGVHNCAANNAISEHDQNTLNVTVFPNPVEQNGMVHVLANNFIKNIELVNIIGQVVKTETVSEKTGVHSTNVGSLSQGVYLMRLTFRDNTQHVQRITIR